MAFKFHCPHCDATIKATESHVGKKVACPKCGERIVIENPESASEEPALPQPDEASEDVMPEINIGGKKKTRSSRTAAAVAPPAVAPPAVAPPIQIEADEDEYEEDDDFDSFPEAEDVDDNPFEAPQAPATRVRTGGGKAENIRITDIRLNFGTVFRLSLQLFAANLVIGLILSLVFFLLSLILGGMIGAMLR